jgi:hypothetical protein
MCAYSCVLSVILETYVNVRYEYEYVLVSLADVDIGTRRVVVLIGRSWWSSHRFDIDTLSPRFPLTGVYPYTAYYKSRIQLNLSKVLRRTKRRVKRERPRTRNNNLVNFLPASYNALQPQRSRKQPHIHQYVLNKK